MLKRTLLLQNTHLEHACLIDHMLHIPLRGLKKKELSMFQESKGVTQIEIRKKYRAETSAALNELSEYLSRPHRKNLGVEGRGRYNNDNKI